MPIWTRFGVPISMEAFKLVQVGALSECLMMGKATTRDIWMHIHDGLRGDNIDSLIGHEKDTSGWVNVSVSQLRSNQFKSQLRRSVCPDQFFFGGGGKRGYSRWCSRFKNMPVSLDVFSNWRQVTCGSQENGWMGESVNYRTPIYCMHTGNVAGVAIAGCATLDGKPVTSETKALLPQLFIAFSLIGFKTRLINNRLFLSTYCRINDKVAYFVSACLLVRSLLPGSWRMTKSRLVFIKPWGTSFLLLGSDSYFNTFLDAETKTGFSVSRSRQVFEM